MALTTVASVISGLQPPQYISKTAGGVMTNALFDTWASVGSPGTGSFSASLNGSALTAPQAGQVTFQNPLSGNTYLARLEAFLGDSGNNGGKVEGYTILLCDRLWHNGGYTISTTTAQSTTFPGLPARDANGSSNGVGVYVALEASASCGNGAVTNTTLQYTGTVNGSGQTGTIASVAASLPAGGLFPFQLAAGDTGVTSVQSLTLGTTYSSGTVNLVAYRVLAVLSPKSIQTFDSIDALTGGMVRLYNSSVPFFIVWQGSTSAGGRIEGQVVYAQG